MIERCLESAIYSQIFLYIDIIKKKIKASMDTTIIKTRLLWVLMWDIFAEED